MDFHQNTPPEAQNENPIVPNQPAPDETTPEQNRNSGPVSAAGQSYPDGQPYNSNNDGQPYQNGQPYNNNCNGQYNQNRQPYNNNGGQPYHNNNNGRQPYQNGQPYNNNRYPYDGYPYYQRNAYQLPPKEPGSGLATTAMILGIISVVCCFTFTVYPTFITGSIAIVLALLSKGRRLNLLSKARRGVIFGIVGLAINTALVAVSMFLLVTDPDVRSEVNKTFEQQYGVSFDEMMEEIMEENGLSE
ncbi:MAG: hypothetical protein NC318_01925 [Blautia sp.]|nr:hypothetical protein [Lachnoclostridium sp.]MCM1210337.1 hypothetical protein [Blautia sp.]